MKIILALLDKLEARGIKLGLDENKNLRVRGDKSLLDQTLVAEIKELRSELIDYLLQGERSANKNIIDAVDRSDRNILASYAQQRLWLIDQIDGSSVHYNMPFALKLSGMLDVASLEQAFSTILERHESLRTCFAVDNNGLPVQVIQPAIAFTVPFTDLSGLDITEQQAQLNESVVEEAGRAFDLSLDLMLRAQLIKLSGDEYIVLVNMHHIASDGWSLSILINEFCALYAAYIQGQSSPLSPLPIQYADYAHWQRNWLQGEVLDEQMGYWTKQLAGLPVAHSLPLDHPRPTLQSFAGNTHVSYIDVETNKSLNQLCQSQGATLFMGLHAAFSVLLARYSNETDIVIGSPIANREQAEVAGLIGFFVNTLILRSDLSENLNFIQLLNQSKSVLLGAYAHQQIPFEQLVERLQPERSLSHSALFQIMLVLQNNEQGTLELPGLTLSPVEQSGAGVAKYDITLNINETEQGLCLGWEYNTDLFEHGTIARMANHFELLLKSLLVQPNESIFSVEMLGEQERHQLLIDWNNTQADYPNDKCAHELFETQVNNHPHSIAVVFENEQLTYQQLNEKANQLAHYLIDEKSIKPDTLVGICVERSLDMIVGILAILKAGGAYVPLDPEYPEARLKYMLDDAKLTTVLTQSHLRETTPVSDEQALCLDSNVLKQQLQKYPTNNPDKNNSGLTSNHLAYIIYTSGSTGNPKGSLLTHNSLCNLALGQIKGFGVTQQSRVLQFASIAFDAATSELCMALLQGAVLVLLNNEAVKSPIDLTAVVKQHEVTHVTLPPVLLPLLDVQEWRSVQTLVVAGDSCSLALAKEWSQGRTLINAYGPSETTVCATLGAYTPNQTILHIGKPLQNVHAYVLNKQQAVAPVNVAGELHIGGVGLSRGYLNRADLTAEKFISNPFFDKNNIASSERLYKTGDLVRWLPDGNLEFLGRIDSQVKIRGFRIELGEIENILSTHEHVKDVVVLAKAPKGDTSNKRLVAYVVSDEFSEEANEQEKQNEFINHLRQHVIQRLPDYMVPSAFVILAQLPLTPNGKVDRKALPEPDVTTQTVYVAPATETEKILCGIWQEILNVELVGVNDNFFQLGGHSLMAMKTLSKVNEAFSINIAVQTLFQAQTVFALSEVVNRNISIQHNKQMASSSELEVQEW